MSDASTPTYLSAEQLGILDRQRARMEGMARFVMEQLELERNSAEAYPPAWLKQPRLATSFAIFGPRGSGKTTLCAALLHDWQVSGFYPVPTIIDCSLSPEDLPIGLAILQQARASLDLGHQRDSTGRTRDRAELLRREEEAFECLVQAYILSSGRAREVMIATSMSGAHFATEEAKASEKAFDLPRLVGHWLRTATLCMGSKVEGLLVVLDDLDLARRARAVRDLVYSLMDELHQPRLLLLVAADLELLEHRAARRDESPQVSNTVRSFIYKTLPQQGREHLRPWTAADRWAFRPVVPAGQKGPGGTKGNQTSPSLGNLLLAHCGRQNWDGGLARPDLLPTFPRALENLWRVLEHETASTPHRLASPSEYLAFLAEGRGQYQLRDVLAAHSVADLGRLVVLPSGNLADETWTDLVRTATDNLPMRALVSSSPSLGIDPGAADAPLWLEVLLDLSLQHATLSLSELFARFDGLDQRASLAQVSTEPLRTELRDELRKGPKALRATWQWVQFDVRLDPNGMLEDEVPTRVGWAPLMAAQIEERTTWPADLLQGLGLRDEQLQSKTDPAIRDEISAWKANTGSRLIIPRRIRALLILVDALTRAPWTLLSQSPRKRSLVELARLCAGLVRAAYLDATIRSHRSLVSRRLVAPSPSLAQPMDQPFLDALGSQGAQSLARWTDSEVERRFEEQARGGALPQVIEQHQPHPERRDSDGLEPNWQHEYATYNALAAALRAYVLSPWYQQLRPFWTPPVSERGS